MGGDTLPASVVCGQPEGCSSNGDGDVLHWTPGSNTCPVAEPHQGGDETRRGGWPATRGGRPIPRGSSGRSTGLSQTQLWHLLDT